MSRTRGFGSPARRRWYDQPRETLVSLRSKTQAVVLLMVAAAAVAAPSGCSFVIESRDRQCERDDDCEGFDNATCDVAAGVCVPLGSTGSAACVGEDGCYACAPEQQEEYLNACTDAECVPYDNAQLQGLLLEDGSLPPVP